MRLLNFCPNWVQITHLPQKRFFSKIDCYYCVPTVFFNATTFRKNPQKAYNKTGPNWLQVTSPNRNVLEKLTNIALV